MKLQNWFRPPRHVLAVFVAVACISAVALFWLVTMLLEQDRTVDRQQQQDRLEQIADRTISAMRNSLEDLDALLEDRAATPSSESLLVVSLAKGSVTARPPERLLFYPGTRSGLPATPDELIAAEHAELSERDLASAARQYRVFINHPDPQLRAEALLRFARVHRKSQDVDTAIKAYSALGSIPNAHIGGRSVSLFAIEGRASTFAETHRTSDLRGEALALAEGLRRGQWQLTKSEREFVAAEAAEWLGVAVDLDSPAVSLADAVGWLSENRHSLGDGHRLISTEGSPTLVVTRKIGDELRAVVAGPQYLQSLCRDAIRDASVDCSLSDAEGRIILGTAPTSRGVVRTAAVSQLPWNLQVFARSETTAISPRRELLLWVAAVLATVWLMGAIFILRAIRHEARVGQLQSDFVAAVSHEFRTPLSSISQITEMLSSHRFSSEDNRAQAYTVLERESERLRRLVVGLLDFQRLEAKATVYHFETVEVTSLLRSVIGDFQESVRGSGYTIELSSPGGAHYVRADREAFTRALWNLLDNAVKYSPEFQTVWVEVEHAGNRISIAVRDRGLGVPVDEQQAIFEKFVRGADSKARRIKGTGIGLAMVRHIVHAHGGEILLVSQPGEGSRFTMVLPEGVNA